MTLSNPPGWTVVHAGERSPAVVRALGGKASMSRWPIRMPSCALPAWPSRALVHAAMPAACDGTARRAVRAVIRASSKPSLRSSGATSQSDVAVSVSKPDARAGARVDPVMRTPKPRSKAQREVRSTAASMSEGSISAKIHLWRPPIKGARKRKRLPVPAPRSINRGCLGSRCAKSRASFLSRAAESSPSRSASQSARNRKSGGCILLRDFSSSMTSSLFAATPLGPEVKSARRNPSAVIAGARPGDPARVRPRRVVRSDWLPLLLGHLAQCAHRKSVLATRVCERNWRNLDPVAVSCTWQTRRVRRRGIFIGADRGVSPCWRMISRTATMRICCGPLLRRRPGAAGVELAGGEPVAVKRTTGAFDALAKDPGIGPSHRRRSYVAAARSRYSGSWRRTIFARKRDLRRSGPIE
jgi:hypothetical protein